MKLKDIEMLCTKVDLKTNKEGAAYIIITLLSLKDGTSFEVMEKNIEYMQKLQPMQKYVLTLDLQSSKYGLRMALDSVGKELGGI